MEKRTKRAVLGVAVSGMMVSLAHGQHATIIRNFDNPATTQLQIWLANMGYNSSVVLPGNYTASDLMGEQLVIWFDLGSSAQGPSDADASKLQSAQDAGVALYFLGSDLAAGQVNLSPAVLATWQGLTKIGGGTDTGGEGSVSLLLPAHPVLSGPFGDVGGFTASGDPDAARAIGAGAIVLAASANADLLIASDPALSPFASPRTLTQNFYQSQDGNLEAIFKNGVTWVTTPVPEPAGASVLGMAGLLLLVRRR